MVTGGNILSTVFTGEGVEYMHQIPLQKKWLVEGNVPSKLVTIQPVHIGSNGLSRREALRNVIFRSVTAIMEVSTLFRVHSLQGSFWG